MAFETLMTSNRFPAQCNGSAMAPNILLMCKLMFALVVVHGFYNNLNDPYIPFLSIFDWFNNYPGFFSSTLRFLFVASGVLLLINYKVRLMSFILGSVICITLLGSMPRFTNHYFICACVFLLAAFTDKSQYPWLIVIQLGLVYFGASLNKMWQIDWWNGRFMYNWLAVARENQLFIWASKLFPDLWLAKVLSWGAMLIEMSIVVMLTRKKWHTLAVWTIILFHTILYALTAFRFGHFYEDILITLLIFLNWPKSQLDIAILSGKSSVLKQLTALFFLNQDVKFIFKTKMRSGIWLRVKQENKTIYNWQALKHVLLYNTNFYIGLFLLDLLIRFLFNNVLMHTVYMIMFWGTIISFLGMSFSKTIKPHNIL